MKRGMVCWLVLGLCTIAWGALAVDLTQTHDPLERTVGTPSWNYDTGWIGVDLSLIGGGVYVRLSGGLGGTVFDIDLNGQGKLTYPTVPGHGDLWFQGTTGSATQDIGIEMSGQYKIVALGTPYIGNLPFVPNTDIRLKDTETFTPYMLGQSVTLSDSITDQNLYVYHIGSTGVFSGDIGVSLSAKDDIKIDFKRLNTDKAIFTVENERKDVAVPNPTLTVGDIYEMVGLAPTLSFRPNVIVGITILGIPFDITIPTIWIDVPLASLLQPEYPTTPSRSITFTIPPTVTSYAINSGALFTFNANVNLNNNCTNSPTAYIASENTDFGSAGWNGYSTAPAFLLSAGDGLKRVYFKVLNVAGESLPVNDTIVLSTVRPTVNSRITNDATPALSGTVAMASALVSVTVAGQTVPATNNDDGTWTLWDNVLAPIGQGTYDVAVTIADPVGNTLSDMTTGELTIDLTPPVVGVNVLLTGDATPTLTGTVTDNVGIASAGVIVNGHPYAAGILGGIWTANVTDPLPEGVYNVLVWAVDTAGNTGFDTTTDELMVDLTPPTVTVDVLATSDTTPPLSGTIDDLTAAVWVSVSAQTLPAVNHGDGTWSLPDNALSPLPSGIYDVYVLAVDTLGNEGHDITTNELTVDAQPPVVTVNSRITNDTTPELTGTVSDLSSVTIVVTVGGQMWVAMNNGNGTWTLPNDTLYPLDEGLYDVQITATDAFGNVGHDTTTHELTIDTTKPTVTVNFRRTNDTTPELTGTVNDGTATMTVSVSTQTWPAVNYPGQNRWTLPDNQLSPLPAGTYNVRVSATDPAGNVGTDTTFNELTIDLTPPTVAFALLSASPTGMDSVAFRVTFNESVTPSFTTVTLIGSLAGTTSFAIAGPDPVYTVTLTPTNPDANGTLGIRINAGTVTDVAGNACAGGISTLCFIQNWCGFGTQPQDARIYIGDAHTFTAAVGCTGVAWAYQWKWDDGGKTIHDGPAASSWTLSNATTANRGEYWCVVTYDGIPHASEVAVLEVEPPLAILAEPEGAEMMPGESYAFSVLATGGYMPLHYQWNKGGTLIPEATDPTYSIPLLEQGDTGAYVVEITDDNGATVASAPANLTVSSGVPVESRAGTMVLACACALAGIATIYARRRRSAHRPKAR